MPPALAIDLTRLLLAPLTPTPRGIDRVEFAYALWALNTWPGECFAVIPTMWGVRAYERQIALRGLRAVAELWGENAAPEDDPLYQATKAWLHGQPAPPRATLRRKAPNYFYGFSSLLCKTGFRFGQPAAGALSHNGIYLNVGQLTLASLSYLSWLARRPDIKPVFMIHDAIPLDYPEFVPPNAIRSHRKKLDNVARLAQGLIAPSGAALERILFHLHRHGRPAIKAIAPTLPVGPEYLNGGKKDHDLDSIPYFVICGAIESRKNHSFILNVWREIIRHPNPAIPKLVVIGTRERTDATVIATLERSSSIRAHVLEVNGLSTPSLRRLLASARALLMPSLAEGFGLPIVEAMALGTPVIASDLPAHREAGDASTTYLAPIDGIGWVQAIQAHMSRRDAPPASARPLRTWENYFTEIEQFLQSVSRS
jgi:glycosyltransferase involved in cell wall biosynthesis